MVEKHDKRHYLDQVGQLLDYTYNIGYRDGFAQAKEDYGKLKGIAHVKMASKEDIERWGIELHGWCDCGKPIEGRWVGMANFCPWCGKIMEWSKHETET